MFYDGIINGKFIFLRSVCIEDAEFILNLRLDYRLNRYINKTENDIMKQKKWIGEQIIRPNDYYFIISDLKNNSLGTISLYNIVGDKGEFGRWISVGNAIENLESVILIHVFGFEILGLNEIYSNTVRENTQVINFHRKFGAKMENNTFYDEKSGFNFVRGIIKKSEFEKIKSKNYSILEMFK